METTDTNQGRDSASHQLGVVGQLVAGIAHEINTPVQYVGDNVRYVSSEIDKLLDLAKKYRKLSDVIQNNQSLCSRFDDLLTAEEAEDFEFLVEEVPLALEQTIGGIESIAGIVRSLKSLVHPGGKDKVATNVNEAVENSVTVSRGEWKHCASVEMDLGAELPQVMCYPGELNQVLVNLIVNAAHAVECDAGGALGVIRVSTFEYKGSVGITIEDSGSGIPLDIQHRIFDPFFTSKDVGKGTGQGLAFAHASIVERSNGTLFFETSEGEGTTFHIYLPCCGGV